MKEIVDPAWALEFGMWCGAILAFDELAKRQRTITVVATPVTDRKQIAAVNPSAPRALTAYRTQMEKSR